MAKDYLLKITKGKIKLVPYPQKELKNILEELSKTKSSNKRK